ncbi:DUF5656 family protein [Rheinheimera salexigens]|uniref:Uncharacterized protein n=1 Tax=Rheinheimera salexigens TaxID=1628148 RepID=A0A1E7Q9I9_9GAMM|nr:hypothetical protein [Rheinheimera salexigens]OEY70723.1 hypothetical protein BI198_15010 [Rheinheimera salexigens]
MVPLRLYEVMPYIYFIAGASILQLPIVANSWLGVSLALLLMARGATIWVLRSHNRRSDGVRNKSLGPLPFWLYELLPFVYAVSAVCIFSIADNLYLYPSAAILLSVFLLLYLFRVLYRKHQRPDVKFPRQALR